MKKMICKNNKNNFCIKHNKPRPPASICAKCKMFEELDVCAPHIYDDDWCLFFHSKSEFKREWVSRKQCGGECENI